MLPTSCQAASWMSPIQQRGPGSLCLQFLPALWHVLLAICLVLSLLTVNSLLTLWQGTTTDCCCPNTLYPGTSHPTGGQQAMISTQQKTYTLSQAHRQYLFLADPLFTLNPPLKLNNENKNQKLQANFFLSTVKTFRSEQSAHWKNGKQPTLLCAIKCF